MGFATAAVGFLTDGLNAGLLHLGDDLRPAPTPVPPLHFGIYDWALANGHFKPKSQAQSEARFIGAFSSAAQAHLHFENGRAE